MSVIEKQVIDLMEIREAYKIGSSKNRKLKYTSDVDLEEFIDLSGSTLDILHVFQEKFNKALQTNNIWITDFKCGENSNKVPYRWSYKDILSGYKLEDSKKVYFLDQFKKRSIIKLDVVALEKGELREYSSNYYFTLKNTSTEPLQIESIENSLLADAIMYKKQDMLLKSLKRIYTYYILRLQNKSFKIQDIDQVKLQKSKLIDLFNSKIGYIYQSVNLLSTILLMLKQNFKPIDMETIFNNIIIAKERAPVKFRKLFNNLELTHLDISISNIKKEINSYINSKLLKYSATHEINIHPINIYKTYA